MGWFRQKFSRKNQAIWAKNEPQKMASLTAGGTCSCITVQCTKIHYTVVVCTTQCNTLRIQLEGVQALVYNYVAMYMPHGY